MFGEAHGMEGFAIGRYRIGWTLSPGYAFERVHMHLDPGSQDTSSVGCAEGSGPVNSAQFRSDLSLHRGLGWDTCAYFVGRIADPVVPSYTRLDTGITWQAGEKLSFSVFGQNLLQDERLEYVDIVGKHGIGPGEAGRLRQSEMDILKRKQRYLGLSSNARTAGFFVAACLAGLFVCSAGSRNPSSSANTK